VGTNVTKNNEQLLQAIDAIPDDVLSYLTFKMSVPWQYEDMEGGYVDPDKGFSTLDSGSQKGEDVATIKKLQQACWIKFNRNPQMNTAVRGQVGRMVGMGFGVSSEYIDIDDLIREITLDPRNRLLQQWPKFVGRSNIDGELFLCLTLHTDGFIEIDFIDPSNLDGGDDGTGIIFHPQKSNFPLFYRIQQQDEAKEYVLIPSINIALYPELTAIAKKSNHWADKEVALSRSNKPAYKAFSGFYRFIVAWDKGWMVRRAVSHLRTTLEWLNYYEDLKKYEIDHKKSAGAYVWCFKIVDPKAFKVWLKLSDEDKRKTAPFAKKTPGASLVLPPGMELEVLSPKLTSISDEDTDILHMSTSGLNESEDMTMGANKGTYASIKATRAPMTDRISDELAYFGRWLRHDFWHGIFYITSKIRKDFKYWREIEECVGFKEVKRKKDDPEIDDYRPKLEPKMAKRKRRVDELLEIDWPTSEMTDYEARAKGLLGTKHGPLSETIGVPNSEIAKKMGFEAYGSHRLRKATEDMKYPKLVYSLDAESLQEKSENKQSQPNSSGKDSGNKGKDKGGDQNGQK